MSLLDYPALIQDALRDVVRRTLTLVAQHGIPDRHHFYITYRTDAEGVVLAESLRQQYPEEITIVLQHDFRDLDVDRAGFAVTLRFGGVPHRVVVPFAAMIGFYDPSEQFLLRFDAGSEAAEVGDTTASGLRPTGAPVLREATPLDPAPAAADVDEMASAFVGPRKDATGEKVPEDEVAGTDPERLPADTNVVSFDSFRRR
ncbi:MAG: ClpXP protease specificity-enhancing factor SspB [Acidobacteriota bacterium]